MAIAGYRTGQMNGKSEGDRAMKRVCVLALLAGLGAGRSGPSQADTEPGERSHQRAVPE